MTLLAKLVACLSLFLTHVCFSFGSPMIEPLESLSRLDGYDRPTLESLAPKPRIVFRFKVPRPSTDERRGLRPPAPSESSSALLAGTLPVREHVGIAPKLIVKPIEQPLTRTPVAKPLTADAKKAVIERAKAAWVPSVPWHSMQRSTMQALHDASEEDFERLIVARMHNVVDKRGADDPQAARAEIRAKYGTPKPGRRGSYARGLPRRSDGQPPKLGKKTLARLDAIRDPKRREQERQKSVRLALLARDRHRTRMAQRERPVPDTASLSTVHDAAVSSQRFVEGPHDFPQSTSLSQTAAARSSFRPLRFPFQLDQATRGASTSSSQKQPRRS